MRNVIFSLATFCLCYQAFPGGGVTVGNGRGSTLVGLSLRGGFYSERELTNYASGLIQNIHQGAYGRINTMKAAGKCRSNYGQVKALNVEKFYAVNNGEFDFNKEYVGYMQVELKDCKNRNAIQADIPHGGWDNWQIDFGGL